MEVEEVESGSGGSGSESGNPPGKIPGKTVKKQSVLVVTPSGQCRVRYEMRIGRLSHLVGRWAAPLSDYTA